MKRAQLEEIVKNLFHIRFIIYILLHFKATLLLFNFYQKERHHFFKNNQLKLFGGGPQREVPR